MDLGNRKYKRTTNAIFHCRFRSDNKALSLQQWRCGSTGNRPQSLTDHIIKRCITRTGHLEFKRHE